MTVTFSIGDVREQLRLLPAEHFDCVVTSPPYWGLRDYEVDGQIGLERTLGEHLAVMVDVFREVRRVLKRHGTLWLNYGDCYAAAPNGKSAAAYKADGTDDRTFRDKPFSTVGPIYDPAYNRTPRKHFVASDRQSRMETGGRVVAGGYLKPKDLCMIPNRLAIALQDDGWWVRSEIIWHKPNPMPESVYDRPTVAHEKVWLLTKGEDYFYNHEAIREPVQGSTVKRLSQDLATQAGSARANGGSRPDRPMKAVARSGNKERKSRLVNGGNPDRNSNQSYGIPWEGDTRNARNVWKIAPKAFREAHFATFPPALAERCIKAGVPLTTCSLCGSAQLPEVCGGMCSTIPRQPGRVLDPFGGAGTVGLVADQLGLDCTLIELNPGYAEMARRRIYGPAVVLEAAE